MSVEGQLDSKVVKQQKGNKYMINILFEETFE